MELQEKSTLTPQHTLWGEWLLDEYSTTRLRVSKRPQAFFRDIGRQALSTLMALAIAFALFINLYANVLDTGWLLWPLIALFLVVAFFGLLGVVRAIRQAWGGTRIEVDAQQKTLWGSARPQGLWKSYMAKTQCHGLQQVHAVVLHTFHNAGAERKSNSAMCELLIELKDGQCLQGPEVWAPEASYNHAQERLHPLAEAIAQMAHAPLLLKETACADPKTSLPPVALNPAEHKANNPQSSASASGNPPGTALETSAKTTQKDA
ncbi:MAG: hypothetical protein FWG75_04400 [Cystobacterineae bacterium]|nr:hypothetical protein [Cystobacterineae bacterium]